MGKPVGSVLDLRQVATPAATPAAGLVSLYSKSGNGLFLKTSAAAEVEVITTAKTNGVTAELMNTGAMVKGLIMNGSFDAVTAGKPDGWAVVETYDAALTVATVASSPSAGNVAALAAGSSAFGCKAFKISNGRTYRIRFSASHSNTDGTNTIFRMAYGNVPTAAGYIDSVQRTGFTDLQYINNTALSGVWVAYDYTWTAPISGFATMTFYNYLSTGILYIDEVTIEETTVASVTTHASTHASGGSDAVTLAESQVTNLVSDLAAKVGTGDSRLSDARTPTAHAASHNSGGSDALALAQAQVANLVSDLAARALTTRLISAGSGLTGGGSLAADRSLAVSFGSTAGTVTDGADARLSNARTPTAHASTHNSGGGDALQLTEAQVTNLVSDLAGKQAAGSYALTSRLVSTGTGLTGGGDLSADRTHAVAYGSVAGTAVQGGSAISSLTAWVKDWVVVATTVNITLSGTQTIDGVAVVVGDRVLVKNQTTQNQNGIYIVAAGAWTRPPASDTSIELAGATIAVRYGTFNGGTVWGTSFAGGDTLGTTNMFWTPANPITKTYTPTWTAATTAPVMGNAILSGKYVITGAMVHFWITISTGSTTTYGSGQYAFSLPPITPVPVYTIPITGLVTIGAGNPYGLIAALGPAATTFSPKAVSATAGGAYQNMTNTAPGTWVSGTIFSFYGAYTWV